MHFQSFNYWSLKTDRRAIHCKKICSTRLKLVLQLVQKRKGKKIVGIRDGTDASPADFCGCHASVACECDISSRQLECGAIKLSQFNFDQNEGFRFKDS